MSTQAQTQNEGESRTSEKKLPVLSDLFDWNKPWVLVENGSIAGYFDYVPIQLRVGPWHPASICFLGAVLYVLAMLAIYFHINTPEGGWMVKFQEVEPYEAFTNSWYYNVAGFLWTFGLSLDVYFNGFGGKAWGTYTLHSWTFIMLRHLFCALAPFFPSCVLFAEILRLPVLITACVTFIIWNFLLAPAILIFFVKDPVKRSQMFKYFTNFRLTQLHVANIFLAIASGALTHPIRQLYACDLYVMGVQVILYMSWYYGILDRIGVHLYPIFSPRTPFVIISWFIVAFAYIYGYFFWQEFLARAVLKLEE